MSKHKKPLKIISQVVDNTHLCLKIPKSNNKKSIKTIQIHLNDLPKEYHLIFGYLTYHAGKLWNQANYYIDKRLAKPHVYDLYHKLKDESIHLKSLMANSSQIILSELVRGWKNFFDYCDNKDKYYNKINPPKYMKKKSCHRPVTWIKNGGSFKIEGTKIRLSLSEAFRKFIKEEHKIDLRYLYIDTKYKELSKLDILNIKLVPIKIYNRISFKLCIIYKNTESPEQLIKPFRVMSIDYGSSNVATCVISGIPISYIIDGRGIKSLLYKYLKKIFILQKRLDNIKNQGKLLYHRIEEKLHKLFKKISNLNKHFSNKVSNLIVSLVKKYNVRKVIIGDMQKHKCKKSKMDRKSNIFYKYIPHGQITDALVYKLNEIKSSLYLIDESYTSKIDSTDPNAGFVLIKNELKIIRGKGYRIKRGLFKTHDSKFINSDVNAARNILKKFLLFDEASRSIIKVDDDISGIKSGLDKCIKIRVF